MDGGVGETWHYYWGVYVNLTTCTTAERSTWACVSHSVYLKEHHNARMVFYRTYPTPDMSMFQEHDWCGFYADVDEAIPTNTPEPRWKEVYLIIFFDSYHAGDKLTRRYRTGYIIFLNNAPISWLSKKQATIETSVFWAEFVAMRIGMETLRVLRYKLYMMGEPISGPSLICGKICQLFTTHSSQSPHWRKSWIQFFTMRLGDLWKWRKVLRACAISGKPGRHLYKSSSRWRKVEAPYC